MGLEATSKMRRHDHTSSSEEDDLVDLLGSTYQVNRYIYYNNIPEPVIWKQSAVFIHATYLIRLNALFFFLFQNNRVQLAYITMWTVNRRINSMEHQRCNQI